VTVNAIRDQWRRDKRQARAVSAWRDAWVPPDELNRMHWIKLLRQRLFEYALEKVKERARPIEWACFERHILEKQRGKEVADGLGISRNSVYVYSSRVFKRVRKYAQAAMADMEDEFDELPGESAICDL
jgi:DNA-directed RNA polymerase specialized sigma24 family protein